MEHWNRERYNCYIQYQRWWNSFFRNFPWWIENSHFQLWDYEYMGSSNWKNYFYSWRTWFFTKALQMSMNGINIIYGGDDGVMRIWNLGSFEKTRINIWRKREIWRLCWSRKNNFISYIIQFYFIFLHLASI